MKRASSLFSGSAEFFDSEFSAGSQGSRPTFTNCGYLLLPNSFVKLIPNS